MYTEYIYNDSLAHHGILGQKWGIMNGPPYPLDYEAHSKKEKKLNSKGRIDGKANTSGSGKKSSKSNVTSIKSKSKTNASSKSESKEGEKKHLTEKQKKIIKGVAIGAGVAAVVGLSAYAYYKNPAVRDKVNTLIDENKNKAAASITKNPAEQYIIGENGRKIYTMYSDGVENTLAKDGFSVIAKTAADGTVKLADSQGLTKTMADYADDIKICNMGSQGYIYGRNHNCINNALNMFVRDKHGIDSIAKAKEGSYTYAEGVNIFKVFNISKEEQQEIMNQWKRQISPEDLISQLRSQPDGSCGILGPEMLHDDGRHFLYWKKVGDEFHVLDGQIEVHWDDSMIKRMFSNSKHSSRPFRADNCMFFRVDDREINWDLMKNYIEPNKGDYYDITDKLVERWQRNGLPVTQLKDEVMKDGKIKTALKPTYRLIKAGGGG